MFAIKHKPTGTYLPLRRGNRRGSTYVNVGDTGMPHLFPTKRAATHSLRWWLKGEARVTIYQDYSGDRVDQWETISKPERKASDMEVVEVNLVEVEQLP